MKETKRFFGKLAGMAAAMATAVLMSSQAQAALGQSEPWQLGLQEAASPMKEKMEWFHNELLLPIITGIVILVFALLLWVMIRYNAKANPTPSKTTHNTMLEIAWTLVPVLILVVVVIPSMRMLYFIDRTQDAEMTLKVTGYQWYWGYEYPDHGNVGFQSYMLKDSELKADQPRLLATDNPVVLPVDTNIRILTTGNDVIHAWAVPALGIKIDAVPGRTNETWVRIDKEGTFYGQCSEICGTGHGFMPIEIKGVSKAEFAEWVKAQGGTLPAEASAESADVAPVAGEAVAAEPAADAVPVPAAAPDALQHQ